MAPPAPVMAATWPASGSSFALTELDLLRRPILAVEHVSFADRLEAPDGLGVGNGVNGAFCYIGGDAGVPLAAAETEEAEPGHQNHARQRIEHDPAATDAGGVAGEIGLVGVDEVLRGFPDRLLEVVELACSRRSHDQWPILGANGVIGCDHASPGVARDVCTVDEREDGVAITEFKDQPPPDALDLVVFQAAGPAQDRGNLGQRGNRLWQRRGLEHHLAATFQSRLGEADHLDHALVGLARAAAEGEDAVLVEDQSLDTGVGVEHLGRGLGEAEPRPVIGHEAETVAVDLACQLRAVRLIDQTEHGVGMRVVDVFCRHEGMQQHLHGWAWRHRIEEVGALHAGHVGIVKVLALTQLAQGRETNGRQPRGLDGVHVLT